MTKYVCRVPFHKKLVKSNKCCVTNEKVFLNLSRYLIYFYVLYGTFVEIKQNEEDLINGGYTYMYYQGG